mmetsp:Transcript_19615/g.52269  ORF Transcript_19615/g.52269 Transcript_19615/m.52269 type:complete len:257 (+) Transcript_19615:1037-1807(+)
MRRLILVIVQSSSKHFLMCFWVSRRKGARSALGRIVLIFALNSVSVMRGICTMLPPGSCICTMRRPMDPDVSTCVVFILELLGMPTCGMVTTTPLAVLAEAGRTEDPAGAVISGRSLLKRNSMCMGASFSMVILDGMRSSPSTWNRMRRGKFGGTIRAPTNLSPPAVDRSCCPCRKASMLVKAHTARGAESSSTGHSMSIRCQPSHAQHGVWCSSPSRSRSTSSSVKETPSCRKSLRRAEDSRSVTFFFCRCAPSR